MSREIIPDDLMAVREMETLPVLLGDREIRRVRHEGEWWFAMEDVVAALTEGPDPAGAWQRLKEQVLATCGADLSELCRWLEMAPVTSGYGCQVEAATLEGIFRIVQEIFSPKAEILKRWLAKVAAEPTTSHGYRTNLDTVFDLLEGASTVAIARSNQNEQGVGDRDAAQKAMRITDAAKVRLKIDQICCCQNARLTNGEPAPLRPESDSSFQASQPLLSGTLPGAG